MTACTTMGCPNPGTVQGWYDDGEVAAPVTYCGDCAAEVEEFIPDSPAPSAAGHATYLAAFTYNATVLRVIDGDTIEVDVDHGFYLHNTPVPVRFLGCNAAERGTPGGDAARDNLAALLPPGTTIALTTAKPDKFAPRWDANVTCRGPDGRFRDLVADLTGQGWLAPWDGKGEKPVPPWPRVTA